VQTEELSSEAFWLARKLKFTIRLRGDRDLIPIDKKGKGRKKKKFSWPSQKLTLQKVR